MSDKPSTKVDFTGGLPAWLEAAAEAGSYTYLLAHADDGVIWGRFDGGTLHLCGEAFPEVAVKLRVETLQQVRLFGENGELFVWRAGDGFEQRCVLDSDYQESYTETYRLWGEVERSKDGFSLMVEGKEGLRHAVPEKFDTGARVVLCVRHYIEDSDDQAAVVNSRLVSVMQGKEG